MVIINTMALSKSISFVVSFCSHARGSRSSALNLYRAYQFRGISEGLTLPGSLLGVEQGTWLASVVPLVSVSLADESRQNLAASLASLLLSVLQKSHVSSESDDVAVYNISVTCFREAKG